MKSGSAPAAPAPPPAPIGSLQSADKELKKIQKSRADAEAQFRQGRIDALSGNKGKFLTLGTKNYGLGGTGPGYTGVGVGAYKGIDKAKLEAMTTQQLASLSDRTIGVRTEAAGRSGTRQIMGQTSNALRAIQGQDQERQQQLQGFIDKQMTELDRQRRKGGTDRGRRGNVKAGQNPNLAKGSALLESKKNLL